MDDGWILKCTPEQLESAAGEWQREIGVLANRLEKMQDIIRQTAGYWCGSGGESYRKGMSVKITAADECAGAGRQYSGRLLQIAGIYHIAEAENTEKAGSLTKNILR